MRSSLKSYAQVDKQTKLQDASPHKIIELLFEGVVKHIAVAKMCMQKGAIAEKGEAIIKASDVVLALKGSLVPQEGTDISQNLDALYDFCLQELVMANASNDIEKLDNVTKIINELAEGWRQIPQELREQQATL